MIVLATFVLTIVFSIGYIVGAKQGTKQLIKKIKKEGGYFDMEITGAVYPYEQIPSWTPPTSSFDEVPTEFLMGGNIDKALHIAGVKEASFEKQKEWADERKQKVETETTLSMEDLLNSLNKEDLQLKAGIKQHTPNEEAIKVASKLISIEKDDNPLIEEKLKIEARKDIIEILDNQNILPTSMMDISDGLSSELLHLCKQSNLGCRIYEEKIPIHESSRAAAFKFGLDPTVCALNGGEDYELLFTMKQSDYDKITLQEEISVIGYMCDKEEGAKLITKGKNLFDITAQGWNAFGK